MSRAPGNAAARQRATVVYIGVHGEESQRAMQLRQAIKCYDSFLGLDIRLERASLICQKCPLLVYPHGFEGLVAIALAASYRRDGPYKASI